MPFNTPLPPQGTNPWYTPFKNAWDSLTAFVNGLEQGALDAADRADAAADAAETAASTATSAAAGIPAAVDAAVTAEDIHGKITADIGSRNLVQSTDPRMPQLTSAPGTVAAITDAEGNPTFMQANDTDGAPNTAAEAILRAHYPGLGETFDIPGTAAVILDKDGNITWLEANDTDGGPTPRALTALRNALAGQPATSILVTDGDSMTELSQGGGTGPWPAQVATNTGHTVINLGRSGAWAAEVCTRAGGIAPLITLPSTSLPADTTPLAVTVDGYGGWSNMSDLTRGVFGTIRGIRFRLTYETSGGFKITRVTAGSALTVASPVTFTPDTPYLQPSYVHTLWVGRNNVSNGTDAYTPISRQVDEFRRDGVKFLLFSVCNTSPYGATTGEPSGSANYNTIVALNLQLQKLAPREYVDIRGRLIREGLALAGLTPTSGDTSDIAADMIPRSLLDDGLHPNSAGRIAIAAIVQDELTIRNLI